METISLKEEDTFARWGAFGLKQSAFRKEHRLTQDSHTLNWGILSTSLQVRGAVSMDILTKHSCSIASITGMKRSPNSLS
ncbi:MAG: hypothetical protein GY821_03205 [Gammaproteobacteria bacterium]|nr:hypothetical protein [Gammaproteobacteria bacterium]